MNHRHRYIFASFAKGSDKISLFRLMSSCTYYSLGNCIRVNIPDDLKLSKDPYDIYSTTDDERTLDELGWDVILVYNGQWRKFNFLKKYEPHTQWKILTHNFKLYRCDEYGYTDNYSIYKKFIDDLRNEKNLNTAEIYRKYPRFKEYKKDLNLSIKEPIKEEELN